MKLISNNKLKEGNDNAYRKGWRDRNKYVLERLKAHHDHHLDVFYKAQNANPRGRNRDVVIQREKAIIDLLKGLMQELKKG